MDVFGAVADLYDSARPGYPPEIAGEIVSYHGGVPASVVEIGAGTGKATAVLARIGAPLLTCVEPDERMAAVLSARFPDAEVFHGTFEGWPPPAGGAGVVACAMAWHWLDQGTRNDRACDALAPGGTLAVFGHRYDYSDPGQGAAIQAALLALDSSARERPADWFYEDVVAGGRFADVRKRVFTNELRLDKSAYLALVQTFGPFLQHSPAMRERGLNALGALLDDFGGAVTLNLRTTLVLARRVAGSVRPG